MTAQATQVQPQKLLIDGGLSDAQGGKTYTTVNPATGEPLAEIAEGGAEDVDRAVQAARRAFDAGPWRTMAAAERGRVVWKLGELLRRDADSIAALETLDTGKTFFESRRVELPLIADCFQYYAGWATKLHGETIPARDGMFNYTLREPVGVVGMIVAWNFPLLLTTWKVAPALAAGCTMVIKPAGITPLTALKLGELALEAGVPEGVLNVVPGKGSVAGAALVEHPLVDKIAFTGSTEVGKGIMRQAAGTMKRVSLELGGKSPHVIFEDANLDHAVRGVMNGIYYNKGEVCSAGSRLLVQRSVKDQVLDKLVGAVSKMTLGDPMDKGTRMGPQVSEEQMQTILGYVESGKEDGADLVAGGRRHGDRGFFVEPTIFSGVRPDMKIAQEEIFGPVLAAIEFDDFDDCIAKANDTIYGLASGIWTQDIKRAHRFARDVRAGTVWINTYGLFDPAAPFGGYKQSGFGRELGMHALESYTEVKSVWVDLS